MLRSVQSVLLFGIIASVSIDAAVAQRIERSESRPLQDPVERLLQTIPSVEELKANASHQILALIAAVENGEHQETEWAIRALGAMKSKASPAIAAISKKLSDSDHATRGAAVDALVAIGDDSVVALRELLSSPKGKTRASAAQALGCLKRLDVHDAARLVNDPDLRVRAALADALSRFGKPGVPQLADMLLDPELAVAVEAARALKSNREDASIAIPKLTEALSRANLDWAAADALSAYGALAKRAIPALIKGQFEDPRRHIGPPSAFDIPQLCESLMNADEETRILAAECLALLGLNGKSASVALEAAADKSVEEYVRLKQGRKSQADERFDNSGRVFVSSEYCVAAVWDVTHDTPRFLKLIERLAIAADRPISCSRLTGSQDLSAIDCLLVETMLRHSNLNVQHTALNVLTDAGPKAEPLKHVLVQMARGPNAELTQKAIAAIATIGASAGRECEPILISKLRDGTIPLEQFADAVERLEIRSEAIRTILESGLHDKDRWTARSCANALYVTSNEPSRTARLVNELRRSPPKYAEEAIKALQAIGTDEAVAALRATAESSDWILRSQATEALRRLQSPDTRGGK
jgi:HEAT repeat protein